MVPDRLRLKGERCMNITNISSPKYNEDGSIDIVITTDNVLLGEMPFTASPNDTELHGRQLYEDLKKGKYGSVQPFSKEEAASKLISANRWTADQYIKLAGEVIRVLSEEKEAGIISDTDFERWKQWISYRKKLRELELTSNDIDWPDQPQ